MLAVHASGVAARYEEESRSVVDLHPPGMRGATYTGPVLDLELEAHQVGHLFEEPGRIVLAPPSLRESLSLRAVLAVVHRHAPQRNHFETFSLVSSEPAVSSGAKPCQSAQSFEHSDLIRGLYRLRTFPDAFLYVVWPVEPGVFSHLEETALELTP